MRSALRRLTWIHVPIAGIESLVRSLHYENTRRRIGQRDDFKENDGGPILTNETLLSNEDFNGEQRRSGLACLTLAN